MICPNCNAQVGDTQAFCGNCGAQLTPTQAAAQPTTPIDAGYQQPTGYSANAENPSPHTTEQAPYGGSSQQAAYGAPYQPQGAANPYGQSPYPPGNYTQPSQQKASDTPFGLSIAGLVCALIGLFPLGFIFAIVALVMNSKQQKSGIYSTKQAPTKVMGIIGLVMSILWTVLTLVFGVALIAAINESQLRRFGQHLIAFEWVLEHCNDLWQLCQHFVWWRCRDDRQLHERHFSCHECK